MTAHPAHDAVIVGAVRSPLVRGRADGAFAGLHPVDLLAQVLRGLVDTVGVDPAEVDDVIGGCVTQTGEQSSNITRSAVLAAGFPECVPATTVDRQCGSSQQAVAFAAQGIASGAYDLAIACGVESMSRVPMFSNTAGADPYGPTLAARYDGGLVPQGIAAELVAARWGISRAALDEYAVRSHTRAAEARAAGHLGRSIVPITTADGVAPVTADNGIRTDTDAARLAALRPAFADDGYARRFPQIDWRVTAGNSSQISDGASAVLLASREKAARLGLRPRARFHTSVVVGADPVMMLTAVVPATAKALRRANLTIDAIDAFEVNEAFACVPLAWLDETSADPRRVNVHGGAIALGHPLGASGARLLCTLLDVLETGGGRFGLQTMCEAGGLANATVVERLDV
ncbi:thiolase family protein [Peterkaempfera bronchialis]|uniref:Thiolase family protein n=1 Tax=Peterkaempfera bronchialis TaxID=2126346 RepID=A0A345SRD7_9ACTN|nr:thiolase family protein [Peterkaempfera bronchialis]AXI76292.1 thiolase family protein [Peterkaempfera bronchialis]